MSDKDQDGVTTVDRVPLYNGNINEYEDKEIITRREKWKKKFEAIEKIQFDRSKEKNLIAFTNGVVAEGSEHYTGKPIYINKNHVINIIVDDINSVQIVTQSNMFAVRESLEEVLDLLSD